MIYIYKMGEKKDFLLAQAIEGSLYNKYIFVSFSIFIPRRCALHRWAGARELDLFELQPMKGHGKSSLKRKEATGIKTIREIKVSPFHE